MPSPTRSRCAAGASVHQMLDVIAPALFAHGHDTLVHVVRHRRTFDLGVLPLDPGEAAIDRLIGATAPHEWHALGFVTDGTAWARTVDGDAIAGEERRVRLAVLVDRSGAVASCVRAADHAVDPPPIEVAADEPPTGWVVDVCQRVLGIPTAPAAQGVGAWLDVVWLDALLAAVCATPSRRWSWADLATLHPLQPSVPVPGPHALADDARCAVAGTSWSRLRELVASGDDTTLASVDSPGGWSTVELAGWLDDGAFARHHIGRYPPARSLLGALAQLLPTQQITAVHDALIDPP